MLSREDVLLRARLWNETMDYIHGFFRGSNYTEVRTPVLVACPGMEPNLDPVGVDVRTIDGKVYRGGLITSPEYSMKKLLGLGMEAIYTTTPVFRNVEKLGERWSVEFTMLEWYRQGSDYRVCMEETERLVTGLLDGVSTDTVWPRVSYVEEFTKKYGVHPVEAEGKYTPQQVADLFQFEIMPELERVHDRFFLMEYPVAEAALAQKSPDGKSAQRFEAYVSGIEICNGFTELVQAEEQRARFVLEAEERRQAGKEVFPIDDELLSVLGSIQSPTYGNALGVDRLVMLRAGVKDIDAVHLFPPSGRFS
jgi:lysyl-tRNA synthetase class 2